MLAACLLLTAIAVQDFIPPPSFRAVTPKDVEAVVRLYERAGLPFPPDDAVLVQLDDPAYLDPQIVFWCYLLPGEPVEGPVRLLCGTHVSLPKQHQIRPVDLARSKPVEVRAAQANVFFMEPSELALVAAEGKRGHLQTASKILKDFLAYDGRFISERSGARSKEPNWAQGVGSLAALHWVNEWINSGSEQGQILNGVVRALKEFPALVTTWEGDRAKSLVLTFTTPMAPAGSMDALMDALLDCPETGERLSSPDPAKASGFKPLLDIVDRGFDIIPTLIAHLDDKRLTRARYVPPGNGVGDVVRVSDLCCTLLAQYRGAYNTRILREEKKLIKAWWATVKPGDEAQWCLKSILTSEDLVPEASVRLAQKRHPEVLLQAYNVILRQGKGTQTSELLSAMEDSTLDKWKVEDAAVRGCRSKNLDQVHSALWTLHSLRSAKFTGEMVKALDSLNATAHGGWMSPEASFAQIAANSDASEVWDALTRATKRANVDLRLELIQHSMWVAIKGKDKAVRLRYLRAFFNDPAVAHKSAKDPRFPDFGESDIHIGAPTLKIAMMARYVAGAILKLSLPPREEASDAEWSRFAAEVDAKVASLLGGGSMGPV